MLHGHETGRIVRFANGEYIEVHKPLDAHERWLRVQHDAIRPLEIEPAEDSRGVRRKGYRARPHAPAALADVLRGPHRARDARPSWRRRTRTASTTRSRPSGRTHRLSSAGAVGGGQHLVDPQDETAPDGRNR